METLTDSDVLEDAKKQMFAEDLISFFLFLHDFPSDFKKAVTGQSRRFVPMAFNGVMQICTCFLYSRISVFNTFRSFEANNMINTGAFILFATHLENRYIPVGSINPQKFLYFCSHLAYMTKSFYAKGKTEIPRVAADCIVKTIKTAEVNFWNGLNIAAFKYFKMALECNFINLSVLESSVKIQFVVHESAKEENDNRIIKVSSTAGKHESDLSKVAVELKKNVSVIDDKSSYDRNNQNKVENKNLPTFHEENVNNEVLSKSSSSERNKEKCVLGEKKKSHYENKTAPLDAVISSKRKRLLFKIINGIIKKEIVSPKKNDRVGCSKMEEKENYLNLTYPATQTEIIDSPKQKKLVNCAKMEKNDNDYKMAHPETRTQIMASPKKKKLVNCAKMEKNDNDYKMAHPETGTQITVSPKMEERVNNLKSRQKINDLSITHRTLLNLSEQELSNCFNDSKPMTLASTTVTYSHKNSPRISDTIDNKLFSSEFNAKLPNSAEVCSISTTSTTDKDFERNIKNATEKSENRRKSETENSPMVTADFDICDKFVIDIVTNADELELYGETHANFLSNEDDFNSMFDILSVTHYMATCFGTEFLDIETID